MAGSVPARIFSVNGTHDFRGVINFDSTGAATGIEIGTLPKGSFVLGVWVDVITAFNAGGTNVLEVGTAADPDGFAVAAETTAGTAGLRKNLTGAQSGDRMTADDTPVVVRFTQTAGAGSLATAGSASVLLQYYPHKT